MSDIDTVLVESLKALDPERPIREASYNFQRSDAALRFSNGLLAQDPVAEFTQIEDVQRRGWRIHTSCL